MLFWNDIKSFKNSFTNVNCFWNNEYFFDKRMNQLIISVYYYKHYTVYTYYVVLVGTYLK